MTVNIVALMKVREMLGWSHKTVEFAGGTLVDFLKKQLLRTVRRSMIFSSEKMGSLLLNI